MWFLLNFLIPVYAIQCKDESNNDVSSWEIMKLPQSTSYIYSTDNKISTYDLNSTTQGALANTLNQVWIQDMNYVMYNDEPPFSETYNFSVAHAKAVLFWDKSSAVGIFHSIPKFPVGPDMTPVYTGLLENAWEYAQHVVCVTMTLNDVQNLVSVISSLNPLIYSGSFNVSKSVSYSDCYTLSIGNRIVFAKPSNYNVDIWADCISPYFSSSLQVISWVHGTLDGPECNVYNTVDITTISYSFGKAYSNENNHAKWGIGMNPLVCFGDLNRVTSQKTRSGSVICWKDADLYTSLNNIIVGINSC